MGTPLGCENGWLLGRRFGLRPPAECTVSHFALRVLACGLPLGEPADSGIPCSRGQFGMSLVGVGFTEGRPATACSVTVPAACAAAVSGGQSSSWMAQPSSRLLTDAYIQQFTIKPTCTVILSREASEGSNQREGLQITARPLRHSHPISSVRHCRIGHCRVRCNKKICRFFFGFTATLSGGAYQQLEAPDGASGKAKTGSDKKRLQNGPETGITLAGALRRTECIRSRGDRQKQNDEKMKGEHYND